MVRSCLKLDIKLGAFEAVFVPDFSDPFDLQKATSPPYAIAWPHDCLYPAFGLGAASCTRPCIGMRLYWRIAAPVKARNFFHSRFCSISQAHQSECKSHDGMHLLKPDCLGIVQAGKQHAAPAGMIDPNLPGPSEHCRMISAHGTPATLDGTKRQIYYIIVIDIYGLRSKKP